MTTRASQHSGCTRLRLQERQNPAWRLEDEEIDMTDFDALVLDVSFSMLPDLLGVAAAPSFTRLTILCLRETGLKDIGRLQSCPMLVHLDLSSNAIVDLIGGDFWAHFPNLLVLLLHGNKVKLFVCHLVALTIHDRGLGGPGYMQLVDRSRQVLAHGRRRLSSVSVPLRQHRRGTRWCSARLRIGTLPLEQHPASPI